METDPWTKDDVMSRECIREISKKLYGMHIEYGQDGAVWLMPDKGIDVTAVMWETCRDFLLGTSTRHSVFTYVLGGTQCDPPSDYATLAVANAWMKPLRNCSSMEELKLVLACVG